MRVHLHLHHPKPIAESLTKYNYVISHLPPDITSIFLDMLIKPDTAKTYEKLKTELISHSGESSQQEIRQLLLCEELGDCKFSELLCSMKCGA